MKTLYRRNEHALQAAEMLAAIASLTGTMNIPSRPLSNCWILMCLNMDRNTIWGSAGGMVFENEKSWDAHDRFNWVNKTTDDVLHRGRRVTSRMRETMIGLFNPLNWKRNDPVVLKLPQARAWKAPSAKAYRTDACSAARICPR